MNLRHTVHRSGALHRQVGSKVMGGAGTKRTNGTGTEETEPMIPAELSDVMETLDVDLEVKRGK